MTRLVTLLALVLLLTPLASSAQALEAFLPSGCQTAAETSASQMSAGATLIAIVNGNIAFEFFGTTYRTGMNLNDGKANAWIYAFYQGNGDSVFFKPYGKLPFVGCTDASQFLPNATIPSAQLGRQTIPNGYVEGAALITALNSDGDYTAYHTANPDSLPSAVVLTVSAEEVLSYPAGTPFWYLQWSPTDQGATLTCFVHALSSETVCFSGPQSVADDARAAGVTLAPNPAHDAATLTVPLAWMGSTAVIEAIDATGTVTTLQTSVHLLSPAVSITTHNLASGMYTLRLRTAHQAVVIPMSIVR